MYNKNYLLHLLFVKRALNNKLLIYIYTIRNIL